MSFTKNSSASISLITVVLSLLVLPVAEADEVAKPTINPNFTYIHDGQAVSGWGLQLGDPENWAIPVDASRKAKSAGGKISIQPIDRADKADAIKITWAPSKNIKGVVAVYGSPIDLSKFENEGALVFDMRMDMKPDKDVTFGMDCGYPCRGEMHVGKILKDLKRDEWTTVPIPLNCFTKEGLDIKKVNGPFVIGTEGKLGISIANVRLQKLPEGSKGCAKNEPAK